MKYWDMLVETPARVSDLEDHAAHHGDAKVFPAPIAMWDPLILDIRSMSCGPSGTGRPTASTSQAGVTGGGIARTTWKSATHSGGRPAISRRPACCPRRRTTAQPTSASDGPAAKPLSNVSTARGDAKPTQPPNE